MMLWRSGRRFREVLSRGRCMSVVNNHQAWKTRFTPPIAIRLLYFGRRMRVRFGFEM